MRVFSVPARYGAILEADVSRAIEQIRLDEYRRAHGHDPIHPDFAIDEKHAGFVFVVIGAASDALATAVGKAAEQMRETKRKRPA